MRSEHNPGVGNDPTYEDALPLHLVTESSTADAAGLAAGPEQGAARMWVIQCEAEGAVEHLQHRLRRSGAREHGVPAREVDVGVAGSRDGWDLRQQGAALPAG